MVRGEGSSNYVFLSNDHFTRNRAAAAAAQTYNGNKYYKITIASGAKEPKTFIDSKHFKYKMIISELYFSTFTTWIIKTLL